MDRLVKPDLKEVELVFQRGQKCYTSFKLTNLMHTMSVAVSLTTTNPSVFSINHPFSIIPPLSSLSYTLLLSDLSDKPPLSSPADVIMVRSSMLPTGKAHQDDLRRLFSKPGPHVFRDATIPVSFIGPLVAEFLIFHHTQVPEVSSFFKKAISGCSGPELTKLLTPAIASGYADFITDLIDAGGDVNFKHLDGRSLIPLAVRAGDIDVLKILIASGCRISNSLDSVLHEAAAMNRVDLMEVLFAGYSDMDMNLADSDGRTPIHVAAVQGHVKVIEFCLSIGGNPDTVDRKGWTPLHYAASEGYLEAVRCLLNCSNAKYVVNKDGKTAFSLAVDNGHSHLLDLLHLGDVLLRAARIDDIHGMKSCLAEGAMVNGRDQNGWTPLHRAAFKGRIEIVKLLLDHGALVDVVDDAGYTPLHCAVEMGHVQVALLLVARGATAKVKSLKGVAAINLNCFKNHPSHVHPLCHEKERV
ncbi:putative Ankyrin repeat family protein [Quillaja saponaria]|uniref:Ankyrin repeat family protein n=1 Tax=Quillaja saponaria TaxID=32244 RepID=A0AAD7QAP8_QUISA|nr:putative Ankyrin repeat family protein [Quillaja saponaria]